MKNIFLITLFIFAIAGAASACSSNCCAGKAECCCAAESKEASGGITVFFPSVGTQDCSCTGSLPLPVSQGKSAIVQQNNEPTKQALLGNSVNVSYNDSGNLFTLSARYVLVKSYGKTTPVPLRI